MLRKTCSRRPNRNPGLRCFNEAGAAMLRKTQCNPDDILGEQVGFNEAGAAMLRKTSRGTSLGREP